MRNFILGALFALGLVVLVGAGSSTSVGVPLANLPLSQAFQFNYRLSSSRPFVVTTPKDAGLVITRLNVGGALLTVTVNGLKAVEIVKDLNSTNAPIIVPPGSTLQLGNRAATANVSIGGYFATRSQLGL